MKLLEIKNNLVKISFNDNDNIAIAKFIALVDDTKSYVAQIVNLKSDLNSSYAIARLIFTFNNEGIVDNYDGSMPSMKSQLSYINSDDIIKLLPIEKPITFGNLAHQNSLFKADETIFEKNLTICAEKFDHVHTLVQNSVKQLINYKEKIVVIDTDHTFGEFEPVRFRRDFKLPLNAGMIDYIYENELSEIEASSKAVIQDIFHEIREYTKTVEGNFIPFNTFFDVVSQQYEQSDIPELALLKHKLLKYKEDNVFADTQEEINNLKEIILNNKSIYIDAAEISDNLQKEVISHIHKVLDSINEYIYVFTKITNKNSNKKLLLQLIENDHIFTTIICSHSYKYLPELKNRAENLIFFAPQTVQHDFASYNTLLNKLNPNEFIIYGALTQNVPFIVELSDLSEDDNTEVQKQEPVIETNIEESPKLEISDEKSHFSHQNEQKFEENQSVLEEIPEIEPEIPQSSQNVYTIDSAEDEPIDETEPVEQSGQELSHEELVEQVAKDVDEVFYTKPQPTPSIDDITSNDSLTEDDLDFIDDLSTEISEEHSFEIGDDSQDLGLELTNEMPFEEEHPLELISDDEPDSPVFEETNSEEDIPAEFEIDSSDSALDEPQPPVVPIYPSEEPVLDSDAPAFEQGDTVTHPKYGKGVIEKLIKYGNKTLCSISFENVGRRLLDPAISELQKV